MDTVLKQMIEILSSYTGIIRVILFGSRAHLNHTTHSDYDIDFETEGMTEKEINILMIHILDRVETLHQIDFIHMNAITNKKLLQNMKEMGKVIYQKQT